MPRIPATETKSDVSTYRECVCLTIDHCLIRGYTEATRAMVSAMREVGVRRLVLCHSWYTEEASRGQAMFLIRWFLLPMIGPVLNNMRETEIWLENEVNEEAVYVYTI